MIPSVYGLPAKCVGYMGLVWAERRNNTHKLPLTRQLWAVFLQSDSSISVLSLFLLTLLYPTVPYLALPYLTLLCPTPP